VDDFFPPPGESERTRRTEEAIKAIQEEEQLMELIYATTLNDNDK